MTGNKGTAFRKRGEFFLRRRTASSCGVLLLALFFQAALCGEEATVRGLAVGSDGRPMQMAKVFLTFPNDSTTIAAANVAADGQYMISIPSTGVWMLRFTGVAHREQKAALYIDRPQTVRLDVRLGGYRYEKVLANISVIGNFNRWNVLTAVPMKRLPDSTFFAEVDSDSSLVAYQLKGVRVGDSFEGTTADSYTYDHVRGYVSLLNLQGRKMRILFDPRKLALNPLPAVVSFADTASFIAGFARVHDELQRLQDSYLFAMQDAMRSGKFRSGFSYDWSGALSSIEEQIRHESDPLLRQELNLNLLTIAIMAHSPDTGLYTKAFNGIPPASWVWSLNPHAMYVGLRRTKLSDAERDGFIRHVIETNPSARTKAAVLFDELMVAKLSDEKEKADHYFDILVDSLPGSPEAAMVRKSYSRQIVFREGKPAPAFSAVSLDDSTKTITNAAFKGRYLLLDFWNTKNEQSVKEREYLNAAYKKYRMKNFTILSLSVDESPQQAAAFRRGKWKMPWLNAYIGKNFDSRILRDYNAFDVPAAFLIDPHGNFVAAGNSLCGKDLIKILRKYLGK